MKIEAQQLLPLTYNRKADRQVAIDHMVAASSAVNTIINAVWKNGNIDSIEFDCEISPSWAIRVIGTDVTIEDSRVDDEYTLIPINLDDKPLSSWLEEIVFPHLIEEVKTYRHEREEYGNEDLWA